MERDPPMRLNPESLNPFLCTHIVYLQALLDPKNNEVIPAKPGLDLKGGRLSHQPAWAHFMKISLRPRIIMNSYFSPKKLYDADEET